MRYTSFCVKSGDKKSVTKGEHVKTLISCSLGIASLTPTGLRIHDRGGCARAMYVIDQKNTYKMQCGSINVSETHAAVGSESSFGKEDASVHLFDLSYEDAPLQSVRLANAKATQVVHFMGRYGGQSGVTVCGTTSGQIQIVDWRMRNALASSVQAFGSVSDLACEGDVVVACGSNLDRDTGVRVSDRSVKLFDIRRPPIRPLPPISYVAREESGPSILRLVRGGQLAIVSASGQIQVQSMSGSFGSRRFYQVGRGAEMGTYNPSLASVTCMGVSSSGCISAFGSTDGGTFLCSVTTDQQKASDMYVKCYLISLYLPFDFFFSNATFFLKHNIFFQR
jgi:hypothetical protein